MGAVHAALEVPFLIVLHQLHQMVDRHLDVVLAQQLVLQILVVYLESVVHNAVVAEQTIQTNLFVLAQLAHLWWEARYLVRVRYQVSWHLKGYAALVNPRVVELLQQRVVRIGYLSVR